jgi:hypothetical protein
MSEAEMPCRRLGGEEPERLTSLMPAWGSADQGFGPPGAGALAIRSKTRNAISSVVCSP